MAYFVTPTDDEFVESIYDLIVKDCYVWKTRDYNIPWIHYARQLNARENTDISAKRLKTVFQLYMEALTGQTPFTPCKCGGLLLPEKDERGKYIWCSKCDYRRYGENE